MKKLFLLLPLLLASQLNSYTAVIVDYGFGEMYSSTDITVPFTLGGRINILALESGSWTDTAATFSSLTASFVPAGAVLVASFATGNPDGPGTASGQFSFSYSGNFNPGDQLIMVAYPTLTLASLAPGQNTPGFFFRTSSVIDGSTIGWVAPSDNGNENLFAYAISLGGSLPNNQFTAGAGAGGGSGFTTIPEPTTMALLAGSLTAIMVLRRRRRIS